MKELGLPKLCILIGCLSLIFAVVIRIFLIQIPVAGYAIIPRTFLTVANNFFLLSIAITLIRNSEAKKE